MEQSAVFGDEFTQKQQAHICACDQAYALGWYENKDKKMDERCPMTEMEPAERWYCFASLFCRKGAEKRLQQEKNDKNRVQALAGYIMM